MTHFHPLTTDLPLPARLNCPFCYTPHPLAVMAAEEVMSRMPAMDEGKMMGVLVVEEAGGRLGYLAAYSGQTDVFARQEGTQTSADALTEDDFVPAVFDYLQPDGYFKTHEAEISALNHHIETLESLPERHDALQSLRALEEEGAEVVETMRQTMEVAKQRRDERRREGALTADEEQKMVRESQFLKAELRRVKKRYQEKTVLLQEKAAAIEDEISRNKKIRRRNSDALQRWLFTEFRIADSHGTRRSLLDIFEEATGALPPSGAGECCEPKLLHYAFTHGLRPVTMAMFWWGGSPKGEVRRQGDYYPACQSKCKPLLTWMLRDWPVEPNPLDVPHAGELEMVYEDECMAVVNKPSGLLSVPGKNDRPSVFSLMKERWPDAEGPIIVHRLDMDTSGLMVVARTKDAHAALQRQFAERTMEKTYVALLERPMPKAAGTIALPLRPDITDRPRQMVDHELGKSAVTQYNIIGTRASHALVELHPETGRTHQLRVHCAHQDGLDNPIVGDRLYGHAASRLCLHAQTLTLTHPKTGQRVTFRAEADFV